MKPSLLVVGAALLLMSASTSWGQTASSTANATASVVIPTFIQRIYTMTLSHSMQRGQTYVILPDGPGAAKFLANGDAGDRVAFAMPDFTMHLNNTVPGHPQLPGIVVAPGQTNTITGSSLTGMAGYWEDASDRGPLGPANTFYLGSDSDFDPGTGVPGIGRAYLWVGGTFVIAPDQQRGVYKGTMTISVDYHN